MRVLLVVVLAAACASTPPRATCGPHWDVLSQPRAGTTLELASRDHTTIRDVQVRGVDRELAAAIRDVLETRPGATVADAPLREDLRRVWRLGVAGDARVEVSGGDVTFVVTPRGTIRQVVGVGGDRAAQRRFHALAGGPYEPARLTRMAEALASSYARTGRVDATVEARKRDVPGGVAVCFATNPGPRVTIGKLEFPGRRAVPKAKLLAVMPDPDVRINRVGGVFDRELLDYEKLWFSSEYWEHGYAMVNIGEPRLRRRGNKLHVEIPIDEGPVYRLGRLRLEPFAPLDLGIAPGDVFVRSKIMAAEQKLRAQPGVVDVVIETDVDREARRTHLTFKIDWRSPWDALRFWLSSLR